MTIAPSAAPALVDVTDGCARLDGVRHAIGAAEADAAGAAGPHRVRQLAIGGQRRTLECLAHLFALGGVRRRARADVAR